MAGMKWRVIAKYPRKGGPYKVGDVVRMPSFVTTRNRMYEEHEFERNTYSREWKAAYQRQWDLEGPR